MPTLITGGVDYEGVEQDENVVRRNTSPVDAATEAAALDHDPDFNELAPDRNPAIGLTTRQKGGHWYDRIKYTPGWLAALAGHNRHNRIIDDQVSSSGTAAAREEAGQFGHGTMMFSNSIEPLNPGQVYGQDYFAAHKPDAPNPAPYDAGLRAQMGNGNERQAIGSQSQDARSHSRDAAAASMYGTFLAGGGR